MFGYRKSRRIVSNATQVFTETFPQPPPSLSNVQAAAATTYDGVDHILGLASEAAFIPSVTAASRNTSRTWF